MKLDYIYLHWQRPTICRTILSICFQSSMVETKTKTKTSKKWSWSVSRPRPGLETHIPDTKTLSKAPTWSACICSSALLIADDLPRVKDGWFSIRTRRGVWWRHTIARMRISWTHQLIYLIIPDITRLSLNVNILLMWDCKLLWQTKFVNLWTERMK